MNDPADEQLSSSQVPSPDADFGTLWDFANSFNAYTVHDTYEAQEAYVRPVLHALHTDQPLVFDLTRLRCALFFDAQALLQGTKGHEEERDIPLRWHRLVDAIRTLVIRSG